METIVITHAQNINTTPINKSPVFYFQYLLVLIIMLCAAITVSAQANLWVEGHDYAVGDFVRTGAAATTTYRCITANQSTNANKPPSADWQQVWPQDPPVAAAGNGPTGNDWVDFNAQPAGVLFWEDNGGLSHIATALSLIITTNNGNFVLANNRNGAGNPVQHVTYQTDYGRAGGPTVAQGNTDWDTYYAGYNPAIQRIPGSNATNTTNCVSYAFNAYVNNAVSQNWTNSGPDAIPFTGELNVVAAHGANGNHASQGGDRAYNNDHVWILTGANPATGQRWKNNSSPLYTWAPIPFTNNSPQGGGGGAVFTQFAIGRR